MGKGVSPNTFGPSMWATIHYICLGAGNSINGMIDIDKQKSITQFFNLLSSIIPCDSCSKNLPLELQKLPIDSHLGNNEDLFKWSVALHNSVNRRLGKKEISVEEARKRLLYENVMCNSVNIIEKIIIFTFGLMIGIIICLLFLKYLK